MNIAIRQVTWMPSWRIIPSRFPPIQLFERVTDPADLDAVLALESLTNDRVRAEVGELDLIPLEDRLAGPGTSAIMAAFTHLNRDGSRFSDGSYGVYYAGKTLATAIAETRYHREQFMRATAEPPMELDMRVYLADLDTHLHDIRGLRESLPAMYALDDYSASQALGRRLREQNSWGIAYDSVRHEGGECVGVFRPPALRNCRQERHLCYVWDGKRIGSIYRKSAL
jgi:RES domain-containing protein